MLRSDMDTYRVGNEEHELPVTEQWRLFFNKKWVSSRSVLWMNLDWTRITTRKQLCNHCIVTVYWQWRVCKHGMVRSVYPYLSKCAVICISCLLVASYKYTVHALFWFIFSFLDEALADDIRCCFECVWWGAATVIKQMQFIMENLFSHGPVMYKDHWLNIIHWVYFYTVGFT